MSADDNAAKIIMRALDVVEAWRPYMTAYDPSLVPQDSERYGHRFESKLWQRMDTLLQNKTCNLVQLADMLMECNKVDSRQLCWLTNFDSTNHTRWPLNDHESAQKQFDPLEEKKTVTPAKKKPCSDIWLALEDAWNQKPPSVKPVCEFTYITNMMPDPNDTTYLKRYENVPSF